MRSSDFFRIARYFAYGAPSRWRRHILIAIGIISVCFGVWQQYKAQGHVEQTRKESSSQEVHRKEMMRVAHVIDGDTFIGTDGRTVRLIGVDAPEIHSTKKGNKECYGKEATEELVAMIANKDVVLMRDVSEVDRYGRLLRYVYRDDVFINGALINSGAVRAKKYPPDTRYADDFSQEESHARANRYGLWGACDDPMSL